MNRKLFPLPKANTKFLSCNHCEYNDICINGSNENPVIPSLYRISCMEEDAAICLFLAAWS